MSSGPDTPPPTRGPSSTPGAPVSPPHVPAPPTTWRQKFEPLDRARAELARFFADPKYAGLAGSPADVREPGDR